MNGTILVVGGSGRNGRAALRMLARSGARVRAAGRQPALVAGVDTVRFDWEEPASYSGALADVSQVYLIAPEGLRGMPAFAR